MSLPVPLRVKLATSRGYRDVTADARDLVFGWEDPGGFKSARVPLDRPLDIQPDEIAYYGQLTVVDRRDGTVLFDGRQEDPGRSSGRDGQVWELTAMGGQAHTRDRTVPYILVDHPLSGLERVLTNAPGGTNSTGEDPGGSGKDSVVLQFLQGQGVSNTSRVNVRYADIARAGQKLARVNYGWDAGVTDANYHLQAVASTGGGASDTPRDQALSTAGGTLSPTVVVTNWANGRDTLDLRLTRVAGGAVTVANDTTWAAITDLVVVAMRYLANGNEKASGYTTDTVLGHEVVADVLGRLLPGYDGTNAVIATTTHPIDQLAYPDGTMAERILQDVLALESGHTWRVWERGSTGRYRFEFVPVPSAVRYQADVSDGEYRSQGSADGLYNMVTVRGRDRAGRIRSLTRTSSVPDLDNAGLLRQGSIDLGDEVWSTANAQRAGDQWLAQRQFAPNAGTLTITKPVLDLQTGRMVMPWEIRPGLIRVRGILPRVDALNATARDGVTVFRIVSFEYRVSDAAATLGLDSYARSVQRMLAGLIRNPPFTRRR